MKCCNSFSSCLIIVTALMMVNELADGRQMWPCKLVAIQWMNKLNAESLHRD